MSGAIAHDTAEHLRSAFDSVLQESTDASPKALAAVSRLLDVLEANPDAVVFAVDDTVSTQQAGALLGVSRMTVVRLIESGDLAVEGGRVHRRISVAELARYQGEAADRRRSGLARLAEELDEDTPPDAVIRTR